MIIGTDKCLLLAALLCFIHIAIYHLINAREDEYIMVMMSATAEMKSWYLPLYDIQSNTVSEIHVSNVELLIVTHVF